MTKKYIKPNGNYFHNDMELFLMQKKIEDKFTEILEIMDFDLNNEHIKDTPKRISRMFIEDYFKGCYEQKPKISLFDNTNKNDDIIILTPIKVSSVCSHHFVPFTGNCHIGYIPNKKIIGLSKFNRIVGWFMRRPQIQEELTEQIIEYINDILKPKGIIVVIKCNHLCMSSRGVNDRDTETITMKYMGKFRNKNIRQNFLNMINI